MKLLGIQRIVNKFLTLVTSHDHALEMFFFRKFNLESDVTTAPRHVGIE